MGWVAGRRLRGAGDGGGDGVCGGRDGSGKGGKGQNDVEGGERIREENVRMHV